MLLSGCACSTAGLKYQKEGASEFVLDSYKIKQGKFSILEMEGEPCCHLPKHFLQEYTDTIDEGDLLNVVIYHPLRQDLVQLVNGLNAQGFRVHEGVINLPLVENVAIKGLTFAQAQEKICSAYADKIEGVDVYLDYRMRAHSKIEIIGEVAKRELPVNGKMRLFEVLSLAGLSPGANLFKSYVLRHEQIVPVDMAKLVHGGDMSQNIVMRPGDKIYIASPMASNVMVMGEVGIASVIPLPLGSMPIREAIAAAGGIPFTGNRSCIQVIRGSVLTPKIYRLSWNHIAFLPNDSLLLMPGDTVYISETPITKWNRFINQILPSSLLIDFGVKCRGVLGW